MASSPGAASRRSRKSIAHLPGTSLLDTENNTTLGITATARQAKTAGQKSRSKSIGPGGLEALNETAGNRQRVRVQERDSINEGVLMISKVFPIVKSILKPTIPLSPPKQIPPHPSSRKSSPAKEKARASPAKSPSKRNLRQSGLDNVPNPFDDFSNRADAGKGTTDPNLGSEEEQQAALREKERKEILERRDARRKSLGNHRTPEMIQSLFADPNQLTVEYRLLLRLRYILGMLSN